MKPGRAMLRSGPAVDAFDFAWWEELRKIVLPPLIGESAAWFSLIEPGAEARGPEFADGPVALDVVEAASVGSWRVNIAPSCSIVVDLLSLRMSTKYVASLLRAAREANAGGRIALVARAAQLNSLREVLVSEFSIDWIVWCHSDRSPLSFVIVIMNLERSLDAITRLVDGQGADPLEVARLIAACARLSGGREGRTAVHRGILPIDQPWTWWDFSPEAAAEREDVRAFGDARPLDHIAEIIFRPARRLSITEIEMAELSPDHVGVASGSRVGHDGELGAPDRQVPRSEINERDLLREGDCVVSAITRNQLRIAVVPAGSPPMIPHNNVLVMRFRASVGPNERAAVLAYLRSARFARGLTSTSSMIGSHLRVAPSNLRDALVPRFSDAFLEAWQRARDARQQLREWADEIDDASFFEASSMRAELPAFLERSRDLRDRVAAAAELGTLEGRIRQRYPHPLALRYENISQMEHGVDRIRDTLECAEHLMLFLAFLGVVNLRGGRVGSLAAWTDERGLRLDWGKADTLLREAVAKAAREHDRLNFPIPELAALHETLNVQQRSPLNQACSELRRWRNDDSHLARGLASELVEMSTRFSEHLRVLFEAAALLTQTPLLAVEDYKRDPHTEEPLARFAYVVGVSAAFRRQWERVDAELTREQLVVRDVHGAHHSLHPWLIRRTCSRCHHAETFVLTRFDQDEATYVAMESGHRLSDPTLSHVLANLVRTNSR